MQCFKCLNKYNEPKAYFKHIVEEHRLRGKDRFICTLCAEVLKNFERFKKHVDCCFKKNRVQNEAEETRQAQFLEAFNDFEMEDADLVAFKQTIKNPHCNWLQR